MLTDKNLTNPIPYFVTLQTSVSANQADSFQYQMGENQVFEINQILQEATDSFDITNMSNNQSKQFSPASDSAPLNGHTFPDMNTDTDSLRTLPTPLVLNGQEILRFTVKDTSGSTNNIEISLIGVLYDGRQSTRQ